MLDRNLAVLRQFFLDTSLLIKTLLFKCVPVEVVPYGQAYRPVAEGEEQQGDEEVCDGEGQHVRPYSPAGREVGDAGVGGGGGAEDDGLVKK